MKRILIFLLLAFMFNGCNLEKDIDLNLPAYNARLVVECYLEVGKPLRLSLIESQSYFQETSIPLVEGAKVQISYLDSSYTLEEKIDFDLSTLKLRYNYFHPFVVPDDRQNSFKLHILDTEGREIKAETRILEKVNIDTIEYKFLTDTTAFATVSFQDDRSTSNYYRLSFNDSIPSSPSDNIFTFDDDFSNENGEFTIGTAPDYKENDTLYISLYHLEQRYFDYLESTSDAQATVGNPFSQPGSVTSAVEGGLGVFTGLVYDQDTIIIIK